MSNEILGKQIATIHNLSFYLNIVSEARNRIRDGSFYSWKNKIVNKLNVRL